MAASNSQSSQSSSFAGEGYDTQSSFFADEGYATQSSSGQSKTSMPAPTGASAAEMPVRQSSQEQAPTRIGWNGLPYETFARGTHPEHVRFNRRDYGPHVAQPNSFHHSFPKGGYYYENPDGSKYYNDGRGQSVFTRAPYQGERNGKN